MSIIKYISKIWVSINTCLKTHLRPTEIIAIYYDSYDWLYDSKEYDIEKDKIV